MYVLGFLYALLIGPLELFFEVLFSVVYQMVRDPGIAIVFLSLAMNFLVLPLYRRADAMQEAERQRVAKMKPWTDHIKRTFKGDERFMMLQTYNRQCGHKPTDALRGSVSLLLEIPFFIAAYHFLSNLQLLQGVSFGPIANLGAPDALINLGGFSVNALPILMTVINLASAVVYMKGLPLSNKIQMYGIAAIFLVLLYNSPAGLVFYWTLNNVFSLVKNLVYRFKLPKVAVGGQQAGEPLAGQAELAGASADEPAARPEPEPAPEPAPNRRRLRIPEATPATGRLFLLTGVFLALLTGAIIPIAVMQSSPTEFVVAAGQAPPLWYVARAFALGFGTFVVWFGVLYWLMSPRGKSVFCCLLVACAGVAVVDYVAFVPNSDNLSVYLQYQNELSMDPGLVFANILATVVVAAVLVVLSLLKQKAVSVAMASLCVAAVAMSVAGIADVGDDLAPVDISSDARPHVTLSAQGKNVVVIMLDRGVGYLVPYLLNEKPELKDGLAGFTFYPNAASFGMYTNVGSPGLYGGYDYRPEVMNARSDLSLVDKQNEALKVMPSIFMENGFDATFFDPTFAGYTMVPDLDVFDDIPDLHTYITMDGTWDTREGLTSEAAIGNAELERGFFCYSLMRVTPVMLRPALYHNGDYNSSAALKGDSTLRQATEGVSKSRGVFSEFMNPYSVLQHLPEMTIVEDDAPDALLIMSNDTAHAPCVLQEPDYIPALEVDNTRYDEEHRFRYAEDGSALEMAAGVGNDKQPPLLHYEAAMAAFRELCNWFDYLRASGVWDNTRIILVSDHGRDFELFPDMMMPVGEGDDARDLDLLMANCLLMVKDFNSDEFTVDDSFMMNADTPALALQGIVDHPVNPFTGNPIDSSYKEQGDVHILYCSDWNTTTNNGNTFLPGSWLSLHDNIFERDNWDYLGYY